ncbi:MAG: DNA glycosylase [candidate division WOR-3 bacterium]
MKQKDISFIRKKLLQWYKENGRDFPWRHTLDPYKIMIAEFMLHRTRAEQVVPVYNHFIKIYPDVFSLSSAEESDIKQFTARIGLHWRYKHFLKAAKYVVDNLRGIFPDNYKDLQKIPGVGEYISCAISIIAFRKPAPIVDSNIARFFNGFFNLNLTGELRRKKKIIDISKDFFDTQQCAFLLFALIDFCAILCKPRKPLCKSCVLRKNCNLNNIFQTQ